MKKIAVLVGGLFIAGFAYAQDSSSDYSNANSFSSDTNDANSFSSDTNDANSFSSDTSDADSSASNGGDTASAPSDTNDANSFSSGTNDANSFSSGTNDANSFSSGTNDANSFGGNDANSFGGGDDNSFSGTDYSSESAASEAPAADEPRKPIPFYVGAEYAWNTVSLSRDSYKTAFGGDSFDSNFYRLRFGVRMFGKIGLEGRYGISGGSSNTSSDMETSQYYGVYLVPTGVLFNLIEVSAPFGYSHTKLKRGNASLDLGGGSFGVNFEVPVFKTDALAFRLTAGGEVYRPGDSARLYGYHAGLRLDFKI